MARQRFIHPDIWSDPTIGKLGPIERLLFIGCFSNADDEGRLLGNAAFLRSTIFPYDDFTIKEVADMRDRMVSVCKNVVYYVVDDVEYLAFSKWSEYQNPRYPKPSKFPPPPCIDTDERLQPNGCKDDVTAPQDCGKDVALGRGGMGRDGMGGGRGAREGARETAATATEMIGDDSVTPQRFYEVVNGTVLPSTVDLVLQEFESKLDTSALKWGMWDAKLNDARGAKYLRSIYVRLARDGLTTAALAEEHEQNRRGRPSARASPDNADDTPVGLKNALRAARERLEREGGMIRDTG